MSQEAESTPKASSEVLEIARVKPEVEDPKVVEKRKAKREILCPFWILQEALTYCDSMQVHPNVPGGSYRKWANALEAVIVNAEAESKEKTQE